VSASGKALSEFVAEATEILEALSRDLLVLDQRRGQDPDPELVNGIFRGAHSLKGLSALFGQERVARLAHRAEDLLDRLRMGRQALDDEVLDALIESVDVFQALLAESSREERSPALDKQAADMAKRLGQPQVEESAEEGDPLDRLELEPAVRAVLTEYEEHRLRENVRRGGPLWRVRAEFDLADFDKGLTDLNARLRSVGEIISTLPSSEPGRESRIAFDLIFGARLPEHALQEQLSGTPAQLSALAVRPPPAPPEPAPESRAPPRRGGSRKRGKARAAAEESSTLPRAEPELVAPAPRAESGPRVESDASLRSLTQTVRVDIGRLDGLMNTVGELLLIKSNLQRLAESARLEGVLTPSRLWVQELARETRLLERKLDALQQGLLEARMVPVGQVFDKLARLVRRLTREAGKEIDFAIAGGEVELDKLIVEELSDPLMHLIRNAIDHGVESPEARVAAGKPRRATVSLRAEQKGNHVHIQVSDDGAGIDELRVREVALVRNLITAAQAQEMSRRELLNLIFLPGFSTARSVSELSGRGVGLDVVKNNIGNLSGIIDVWSERGRGTTFHLTLPVTQAIIRALVVEVSGRTYAVPLNSVLEILSVRPQEIRTVERREVLNLREQQTLPFIRLARLFGLPERPVSRHFVVVVGLAQERMGLAVDELHGQQDVVIKPLGGRLQGVRGIAGATELGDRRTVLVLDVGALVEEGVSLERRRA
jgi:two-component system, chemotaxis family, sensor kinase CheA